jgi:hypothetical protein
MFSLSRKKNELAIIAIINMIRSIICFEYNLPLTNRLLLGVKGK